MCIAIVKPFGSKISEKNLENSFVANPDGAGFASARRNGKKLTIEKGFFSFNDFMDRFEKHNRENVAALIHFRVATSGQVDDVNCHPWSLSKNSCMIHNGILPWPHDLHISDTGCFVRDVLIPNRNRIDGVAFQATIEQFIGRANKLAFMNSRGEWLIYNEESGHWNTNDGSWYSNSSYNWDWNFGFECEDVMDDSYNYDWGLIDA